MNTEGSYHCACSGDLVVASDGRSCVPDCGGTLTESTGTFSTPGWPNFYPSLDFRCVWVIDVTNHTEFLNHTDAVVDIISMHRLGSTVDHRALLTMLKYWMEWEKRQAVSGSPVSSVLLIPF